MIVDLDDPEGCIPLYLRQEDPLCTPVLSHNSSTNNILLKITVPKRTGRKRKRGSQDPYTEEPALPASAKHGESTPKLPSDLRSHSRRDNPQELLRTLKDNVGRYKVEAVAEIDRTHRFRGLADFHHSTAETEFIPKFNKLVYPGEIENIRKFKFNPGMGWKPHEELIPPPLLTNLVLPFNWGWHQNPNIIQTVDQETGEAALLNRSRSRKFQIEYLSHDAEDTPSAPPPNMPNDPDLLSLVGELNEALNERPLWTRRALANRVGNSPYLYLLKPALQYVGYQFKGGPFRDAVIKFGIDPRSDPKYRMYQTIFFKLYEEEEKGPFRKWHDNRSTYLSKRTKLTDLTTHLFDGKSLTLDGKIWQFCDITDPYLARLTQNAPVCKEFNSTGGGFFYNGSWSKIRAVMKLKLTAIRLGKTIDDAEFEKLIHRVPDIVEGNKKWSSRIAVPVPDIKLTEEEREKLKATGWASMGGSKLKADNKGNARKARLRDRRVQESKAKELRADRSSASGDVLPSIETSALDPVLIRDGSGGISHSREVRNIGREELEQYLEASEELGPEDEEFGEGESDLDDYGSQDEDEGNGSDAEDGANY